MNNVIEFFPKYFAPQGHVTFTVGDNKGKRKSVSFPPKDYPAAVRSAKNRLSKSGRENEFKRANNFLYNSIKEDPYFPIEDGEFINAFITRLLVTPDKQHRKLKLAIIRDALERAGDVHVTLEIPNVGKHLWFFDAPSFSKQADIIYHSISQTSEQTEA
jgi:hypothetical protein